MVTVKKEILDREGYVGVVGCYGNEAYLLNKEGNLEVFAIRDSYSGWCIDTDCGRVLEFCRTII